MEKLDYLIDYLLKESGRADLKYSNGNKKSVYRALVNIRQAKPISPEFLKVEDAYLQEELDTSTITDISDLKTIQEQYGKCHLKNADKICLWQGDITKLKIECVINAANSQGLGCFLPNHICIDNQIHTFAGVRLRLECNEKMKGLDYCLETGKAIMTKGYNLPAQYVIHTVGPIVENEVTEEKEEELAACYRNSLEIAIQNGIKTVAFPCISTGVFRFPKKRASEIAIQTVDEVITKNRNQLDKVVFDVWSDEDVMIYERYFGIYS